MPKIVQTAGRDALGRLAPQFAALNDDVLFGEVWSNDALSQKMRSITQSPPWWPRGCATAPSSTI